MPQFDFYSFVSQTFWILLFLSIFYFFILYFYLSKFSEVTKFRKNLKFLYKSEINNKSFMGMYDIYINFLLK